MRPGMRIIGVGALFVLSIVLGLWCYRGPHPLDVDAPDDLPSAWRMRQTLVELLGIPAATHSTGTESGNEFLLRLTKKIESFGVRTRRIDFDWDRQTIEHYRQSRPDWVPPELRLKNLLATIPGRDPSLAPIVVATHHDSCRFGPGAGDAGSAVVALVENLRILSKETPRRTTHFLFTDGEEYGLLGAKGMDARRSPALPRALFCSQSRCPRNVGRGSDV